MASLSTKVTLVDSDDVITDTAAWKLVYYDESQPDAAAFDEHLRAMRQLFGHSGASPRVDAASAGSVCATAPDERKLANGRWQPSVRAPQGAVPSPMDVFFRAAFPFVDVPIFSDAQRAELAAFAPTVDAAPAQMVATGCMLAIFFEAAAQSAVPKPTSIEAVNEAARNATPDGLDPATLNMLAGVRAVWYAARLSSVRDHCVCGVPLVLVGTARDHINALTEQPLFHNGAFRGACRKLRLRVVDDSTPCPLRQHVLAAFAAMLQRHQSEFAQQPFRIAAGHFAVPVDVEQRADAFGRGETLHVARTRCILGAPAARAALDVIVVHAQMLRKHTAKPLDTNFLSGDDRDRLGHWLTSWFPERALVYRAMECASMRIVRDAAGEPLVMGFRRTGEDVPLLSFTEARDVAQRGRPNIPDAMLPFVALLQAPPLPLPQVGDKRHHRNAPGGDVQFAAFEARTGETARCEELFKSLPTRYDLVGCGIAHHGVVHAPQQPVRFAVELVCGRVVPYSFVDCFTDETGRITLREPLVQRVVRRDPLIADPAVAAMCTRVEMKRILTDTWVALRRRAQAEHRSLTKDDFQDVPSVDHRAVLTVFQSHPQRASKAGCGVQCIGVGLLRGSEKAPAFIVRRVCGLTSRLAVKECFAADGGLLPVADVVTDTARTRALNPDDLEW